MSATATDVERELDLDELPAWSPWPARLVGAEPWEPRTRTLELVEREYDRDKYASFLRWAEAQSAPTAASVRTFEFSDDPVEICAVRDGRLVLTTTAAAVAEYGDLVREHVLGAAAHAHTIVELGCGYGYNLSELHHVDPTKRYLGGDYSAAAVALASRLYAQEPAIDVVRTNFLDDAYEPLDRAEGPVVVFTSHAIEQLPSAAQVPRTLARYREKIARVIHLEPVCELLGDGLLDLMRRRYVDVNDYNRDLLGVLRARADVEIHAVEPVVFGLNPLNPTSIVHWSFR